MIESYESIGIQDTNKEGKKAEVQEDSNEGMISDLKKIAKGQLRRDHSTKIDLKIILIEWRKDQEIMKAQEITEIDIKETIDSTEEIEVTGRKDLIGATEEIDNNVLTEAIGMIEIGWEIEAIGIIQEETTISTDKKFKRKAARDNSRRNSKNKLIIEYINVYNLLIILYKKKLYLHFDKTKTNKNPKSFNYFF